MRRWVYACGRVVMRISEASESEGVESKRRGARYPATSDAAPSSRSPRAARSSAGASSSGSDGTRARGPRARTGQRDTVTMELQPPVRITSVAADPRVKGRANVRCQAQGETVTLVIGASGVHAFNLRAGLVLDSVSWAALLRESRVVQAQDAALRMLSTSRRSRRDLELRLRRRETDTSVIADALGRLDALGLLNEAEFALAEATAQLRNGARSSGAVTRRLRQRGVSGDLAQSAVAAVVETEGIDDELRCQEAAEKRVRVLRSYDRATAQRRLTGFLMRRGFAPALVFAAARRVLADWGSAGRAEDADGGGGDDDDL